MSDVKSVIALLCKHMHMSVGSSIKPEYLRLAKYNEEKDEVTQALWKTLHILSRRAVKDMRIDDDFDRYDEIHATKLYFAFMQYPTIEFYALSSGDNNVCRELLLSLGWLIATKNVLNIAVRAKLAMSVLGHEYSFNEDFSTENVENHRSSADPSSQMNGIVEACGHLGHNIKDIAELIQEKIKLTTKIHAASLNTSGLPHLSVHEISLVKKSFGKSKPDYTRVDEKSIEDLKSMAIVLDTHMQWTKKQHVFYDWMVTVIDESKKDVDKTSVRDQFDELSSFVSLLRHVTKKKIHSMINPDAQSGKTEHFQEPCVSRFLRIQQDDSETETWIKKTSEQLNAVEIDVEKNMNVLTMELRKMLKSIPNCVEI